MKEYLNEPVFSDSNDWPIVKLNENKKHFHEAIKIAAMEKIKSRYSTEEDLIKAIKKTIESEKYSLEKGEEKYSSKLNFWKNIENDISEILINDYTKIEKIIFDIIDYYLESTTGDFSISHYNFAKKSGSYLLSRLLYPSSIPYTDVLIDDEVKLKERIQIYGSIEKIKSLIKKGVVVLLPTHFSNLDSVVLAWATDFLGMPAFLYAAGTNLFTSKFWNYTLSRIGTYKVDRNKKNIIYLITLDAYLKEIIRWGCNTTFYPNGGRSKNGSIEKNIKKGLLSSALSAQEEIFKKNGICGEKIFFVPITINYPFVLEAPIFAKQCLKKFLEDENEELIDINQEESYDLYDKILSIASFTKRFFMDESIFSLYFGEPIDIFGNQVNEIGKSFYNDTPISVYNSLMEDKEKYFKSDSHLKLLEKKIIEEQWKGTKILACHLVAYAAFLILKKLMLTGEKKIIYSEIQNYHINYYEIFENFKNLRETALKIKNENLGEVEKKLYDTDTEKIMQTAIEELGAYHSVKPLKKTEEGDFCCKDLGLLIYYSNRLSHYFEIFENFLI